MWYLEVHYGGQGGFGGVLGEFRWSSCGCFGLERYCGMVRFFKGEVVGCVNFP